VKDYFLDHPPAGTLLAWQKQQGSRQYTIASGDTLSDIAQRFNISVNDLKDHNGLNDTRILVGQKLTIPTT
jgi:N-acetylmuramoyl-L-alanine amidase